MRLTNTRTSATALSIGALILRVSAGFLLIYNHGWGKVTGYTSRASSFGDPLNIGPQASLTLAVFAEVICATLVIAGLFTRLACVPIIILFSVILLKISKNISAGPGGGELAALFLFCFITILLIGPGKYSLDKLVGK